MAGCTLRSLRRRDPKFDDIIKGLKAFKIQKLACNHCTGSIWAEKAATPVSPLSKDLNIQVIQKTVYRGHREQRLLTNSDHGV